MSKALISECLRVATQRDVVLRELRVGGIVGTILVAINHGDRIVAGTLPIESTWKILLTYCVPYLVSTYASVSTINSTIISTNGTGAKPD